MNLHFGLIIVITETPLWEGVDTICFLDISVRRSDFTLGCYCFFEIGFLEHIPCNTRLSDNMEKYVFLFRRLAFFFLTITGVGSLEDDD